MNFMSKTTNYSSIKKKEYKRQKDAFTRCKQTEFAAVGNDFFGTSNRNFSQLSQTSQDAKDIDLIYSMMTRQAKKALFFMKMREEAEKLDVVEMMRIHGRKE